MNDKQRIVVVIGFLLIAVYAMNRAFVIPGVESDLVAIQHDNEMSALSASGDNAAAVDVDQAATDAESQRLERRFRRLSALNRVLMAAAAAALIGLVVLRSKRAESEFDEEDEWDDEEEW